ncbi:MAG: hypothetical protein DHS20C09_21150 [marine bacterium B5-7]|nr:MAG: hypothetical protein DHS20C09_21150 [marine bacterium B5-7]
MFRMLIFKQYIIINFCLLPILAMANTSLSDPTRPANYLVEDSDPVFFEEITSKEKIDWKLSAIRISDVDRTAILNGQLVRAGDELDSAKVLEINPVSVVIHHEDRKLIVRLFKTKVIKAYKLRK